VGERGEAEKRGEERIESRLCVLAFARLKSEGGPREGSGVGEWMGGVGHHRHYSELAGGASAEQGRLRVTAEYGGGKRSDCERKRPRRVAFRRSALGVRALSSSAGKGEGSICKETPSEKGVHEIKGGPLLWRVRAVLEISPEHEGGGGVWGWGVWGPPPSILSWQDP